MGRSCIGGILAVLSLCGLLATGAAAHPASGIVVTAKGEVFFVHTGKGVGKIDAKGKLTYIHKVSGGGHFLALDAKGRYSRQFPRLFERITPEGVKPALLYASGGAPFVVNQDGNLYYGSGFPKGDDLAPGGLTLTRLSPDKKRALVAPDLKQTLARLKEAVTGLAVGPDACLYVPCLNAALKIKSEARMISYSHAERPKNDADVEAKQETNA